MGWECGALPPPPPLLFVNFSQLFPFLYKEHPYHYCLFFTCLCLSDSSDENLQLRQLSRYSPYLFINTKIEHEFWVLTNNYQLCAPGRSGAPGPPARPPVAKERKRGFVIFFKPPPDFCPDLTFYRQCKHTFQGPKLPNNDRRGDNSRGEFTLANNSRLHKIKSAPNKPVLSSILHESAGKKSKKLPFSTPLITNEKVPRRAGGGEGGCNGEGKEEKDCRNRWRKKLRKNCRNRWRKKDKKAHGKKWQRKTFWQKNRKGKNKMNRPKTTG